MCFCKGYVIKEYFANYFLYISDVTFDMVNNNMEVHYNNSKAWKFNRPKLTSIEGILKETD